MHRLPDPKKADKELKPKPVAGRIADKITLFEGKQAAGGHKLIVQSPRSADVSPARKAPGTRNVDVDQRSRSAEGHGTVRSGSTSPLRDKLLSPRDQSKDFAESRSKPAMTGMSREAPPPPVTVSVAESTKLDGQGELDTTELKTDVLTIEPDGQDTTRAETEEPPPGSATPDTVAPTTTNQGMTCNRTESDVSATGASDSSEMTNSICPESKGPRKTSSRPERRKSKDPVSPVSPNTEAEPTGKVEVTASKQTQAADSDAIISAPEPLAEKVSSDKAQGNASDKRLLSDSGENPCERLETLDKPEKRIKPSLQMQSADKAMSRQEEPPANTDEPDTAARPDDKAPVVLPRREQKAGGHSHKVTQGREMASEDSGRTPASSPAPVAERPIEKPEEQESSAEHPKSDKEASAQPDSKSRGKVTQPGEKELGQTLQPPNKGTETINQAESKDVEKLKAAENESANHAEKKDRDQPLSSATGVTKDRDGGANVSGTEGSLDENKERRTSETKHKTQVIKDGSKPEETTSGSSSCAQTHAQTESTRPGKATVAPTNEAVSGTERDKGPLKGDTQTNVQTASAQGPGRERKPVASATQPNSVSLEKTENSPDDSHTRGARDEFSSSKLITKATTAAEEVTVKASNGTPGLITAQAGNMGGRGLSFKEPISVSVKSDTDPHKSAENVALCGGSAAQSAEKTLNPPVSQLLPVANGDNWLQPQPLTVKKEPVASKPCQTPRALPSPEANKPSPDSTQQSPVKKLHSPRGQSKDDSSKWQEAPSSWLDVDLPKRKLKVPEPKLSSSGSEGNILDTSGDLDEDDFVEKIKNLCSPFSLPPRKHNHLRPPQPPFAMPAIKEDRFEKTFDPKEFTFGLRKKKDFTLETGPGLLAQLKNSDPKASVKPARASLADRSMLLTGLDSHSWLKEKNPVVVDEETKEEKDDQIKVKSRLEGSCILSSLTSSGIRGKRNGLQTQLDDPISGGVSPSDAGLSPSPLPSPSPTAPIKDEPAKRSPVPSPKEEAQAAEAVAGDSGPPLPRFNDIKLPDYLEKYLPRERAKPGQSLQGQEQVRQEVSASVWHFHPQTNGLIPQQLK